jgi:hypothetical protein
MEIDCVYLSFDTCQEEIGGILYLRLFALLCGYILTVESVAWVYTICILSPSCCKVYCYLCECGGVGDFQ